MGYRVTLESCAPETLLTVHGGGGATPALESALGMRLPRGRLAAEAGDRRVFRIGPTQWLVAAPLAEEAALAAALERAASDDDGACALVSDAYSAIGVRGEDAVDVMSQAVALDLHPSAMPTGAAVRCGFGRDFAIVHCREAGRHYVLYVDAALARHARLVLERAVGP